MSVVVPRAVRRLAGTSPATAPAVVAVVGAGDPSSSRVVYAMVVGLVLIGVAFIVLAFWILRQTRPDLEVLAPLERMGDGEWKRRDPSTQRRMLDEVRPAGAQPLASERVPPPLDAEFDQPDHPVPSWSDLGPAIVSGVRDPTPLGTWFEEPDQAETSSSDLDSGIASEVRDPTPVDAPVDVSGADGPAPTESVTDTPEEQVPGDEPMATDDDDEPSPGDQALSDPLA